MRFPKLAARLHYFQRGTTKIIGLGAMEKWHRQHLSTEIVTHFKEAHRLWQRFFGDPCSAGRRFVLEYLPASCDKRWPYAKRCCTSCAMPHLRPCLRRFFCTPIMQWAPQLVAYSHVTSFDYCYAFSKCVPQRKRLMRGMDQSDATEDSVVARPETLLLLLLFWIENGTWC